MLTEAPAKSTLGTATPFAPLARVTTNQSCEGTEPAASGWRCWWKPPCWPLSGTAETSPVSGIAARSGCTARRSRACTSRQRCRPRRTTSLMTRAVPPGFAWAAGGARKNWNPVMARTTETRAARRARRRDRGAGMKSLRLGGERRLHRGGEGTRTRSTMWVTDGPERGNRMRYRRPETAQVDELSVTNRTPSSPEGPSKKRRSQMTRTGHFAVRPSGCAAASTLPRRTGRPKPA